MNKDYIIYGEPIKGWILVRSLKEQHGAMPGDWGLAFKTFFLNRSDFMPSFFFKDVPKELEALEESMEDDFADYLKEIDKFEACLKVDPQIGYAFYNSCITNDFDPLSDDFHIWVAEKISSAAKTGQQSLSKKELKSLMKIFVSMEEYERAALVRDLLDDKNVEKVF